MATGSLLQRTTAISEFEYFRMTFETTEISLHALRFHAYHGVLPQERTVGAEFTLDLTLSLSDMEGALFRDELEGTVNYAEVFAAVKAEMAIPSALLEHAAARILQRIFADFPTVKRIDLRLRKNTPPMGADSEGCSVRLVALR